MCVHPFRESISHTLFTPAGPRSIQQIFRAAVFIFLPTSLELVAVCTLLTQTFSPIVGALVGSTFVAYIAWSITLTQVGVIAWSITLTQVASYQHDDG